MKNVNVLVACEESQVVTETLRNMGIDAYSCDIAEPTGNHKEWHIKESVLPLLNGNCIFQTMDGVEHEIIGKWNMIIAFPPCTHLSVSGARHFERKREDGRQKEGLEFFCQFLKADCDKIMIENPVNIISGDYVRKWFPEIAEKYGLPVKPTQTIHPWMFGDNVSKRTCLWLKGLSPLVPLITEEPDMDFVEYICKNGKKKKMSKLSYEAFMTSKTVEEIRAKRAMKFKGIQTAIGKQFGQQLLDELNGGKNER